VRESIFKTKVLYDILTWARSHIYISRETKQGISPSSVENRVIFDRRCKTLTSSLESASHLRSNLSTDSNLNSGEKGLLRSNLKIFARRWMKVRSNIHIFDRSWKTLGDLEKQQKPSSTEDNAIFGRRSLSKHSSSQNPVFGRILDDFRSNIVQFISSSQQRCLRSNIGAYSTEDAIFDRIFFIFDRRQCKILPLLSKC
jgi:hypothetical protein